MSFLRPTLATIIARCKQDIFSRLPTSDPYIKGNIEEILSIALAGLAHQLHGHLAWLAKQILPDGAEGQFLDRHASIRGLTRKTATKAVGSITCTGVNGSVIAVDTQWSDSTGQLFSCTIEATIAAGTAAVTIECDSGGTAGNLAAGTVLTLVEPVTGVDSTATVVALEAGTDEETDEALRIRVLQAWQSTIGLGTAADYIRWTLEVAGNTRAWAFGALDDPTNVAPGQVLVTFVRDGDVDMIPSAGEVATTQAYLDTQKPLTADVVAAAPSVTTVNVTISGLLPNTSAVRAAVEAELQDLFFNEATPGETLYLSHIEAAISGAAGETTHTLVAPSADVVAAGPLVLPVLGTVTFV